jgi:murein DD-endopeptidase MepM/ murein hydrolase activator NlpD
MRSPLRPDTRRDRPRRSALLVLAVVVLVAVPVIGSLRFQAAARQTRVPASPAAVTSAAPSPLLQAQAVRPQLPHLPPLHALISPTVLVSSRTPLSDAQVQHIVDLANANARLLVAEGDVLLGHGRTRAVAADPVKVRVWSPRSTGVATAVWQRAAIGEAVVAHAVAKANDVPLGGSTTVTRSAVTMRMRVGAFATTEIPGVGLVVNTRVGAQLGLVPRTGLLLAVPNTDPAVTAAVLSKQLGAGIRVETVLTRVLSAAAWVPPAIGPVTSAFGMRINPFTHQPQFHEGLDIGAPFGAPVYAMTSGEVLYAGAAAGYGNEVVLAHPGGVTTVYGHVSQILVSSGRVVAGQVIALVGSEGESTGPHLHAEIRVQDQPVDPVAWLEAHGVRFQR